MLPVYVGSKVIRLSRPSIFFKRLSISKGERIIERAPEGDTGRSFSLSRNEKINRKLFPGYSQEILLL